MSTNAFKYSILEESQEPLDYYAPVTFLEWFNQQNLINFDINVTFENYKNYILEWSAYKGKSNTETQNIIRDSYIQILREIVINFSTEEERRFINNANFSDPLDLDVILPFFIQKIKSICLFYANTREEIKTAPIQHNLRGSNLGVENLIKKLIFDAARTNQIDYTQYTCSFPPVSAIARGLSVYVEELYDTTDTYYNISPLSATRIFEQYSSDRQSLSAANINSIYPNLYINFKNAIIDAIKQYPFFLRTLGTNNFTINPILSGDELYYLKNRDFVSYLSGGAEELKLNVLKMLAPKYIGTDFYYLSTGNTTADTVSGILFTTRSTTSSPTLNFLNKQYPTTASVPNLNSLYTQYQLGRFFLPQYTGLLIHNTPEKSFDIDTTKLTPNTIYAFPDPAVVGNVTYNSNDDTTHVPLVYTIDLTWNKISRSNQFAFGDVLSNSYNQLYYGYQSQSQDLQKDISGLSKAVDNVQFWTGDRQEAWANPDIWTGLSQADSLPLQERQNSLLVGSLTPTYWGSDIFGNEYGVLKNVFPLRSLSAIDYNDGSIMPGSNTVILSSQPISLKSTYDRKYTIPGVLYFRGVNSLVAPASAALSAIFIKYPEQVREEMSSSVLYFNMYYDTFVIETTNYVILDSVSYDFNTSKITTNNTTGFYIPKYFTNNKLERFAGEWYSERENTLYIAFLNLLPYLSGSNYKVLYPSIYKTSLTNINVEKIYPSTITSNFSIDSYSLSAGFAEPPQINVVEVDGISFTKSEKKSLFNFTYLAKNLNGMPLFVNEQLKDGDWDRFLETFNPRMFRPYYFVYDNNYYNPSMPYLVKYVGSIGGTMGGQFLKSGYLDVGFKSDPEELTYLFADGIKPVQINNIGTYIVQFDWESYNEVSIFVGCSGFPIKNIGKNLIFNSNKPDAVVLDTYGEAISEAIAFSTIYATVTSLSVVSYYPALTAMFTIFADYTLSAEQVNGVAGQPSYGFNPAAYGDYNKWVITSLPNLTIDLFNASLGISTFMLSLTATSTNTFSGNIYPSFGGITSPLSSTGYLFPYADYKNFTAPINCDIIRPTYPDPSVLKFVFTTPVSSGGDIQFCSSPESIYQNVYITRTGAGSGVVLTDPYCIDCGSICFNQFPYGSTVSIIASANTTSEFGGWVGGPYDGSVFSDFSFNITANQAITAVFNAIPFYTIEAFSLGYYVTPDSVIDVGRVTSTDGILSTPTSYSHSYRRNTNVSLSCQPAISGWWFTGWNGGPCAGISDRYICSFSVLEPGSVSAYYVRYYDYNVTVNTITTASDLQDYGRVISKTLFDNTYNIDCSGRTIGGQTGTCTYPFTGTGQINGIGTPIVLSAIPTRGYQFKEWRNTPAYATTNGDTTSFLIASDVSLSAVFDIGFYTLSITFSGGGIGYVKNDDLGIYAQAGNPTYATEYNILSGTVLTLYASAFAGNTIMGLSSRTTVLGFGASAIPITMNTDVTMTAIFSAGNFYTLQIQKFGTNCGVVSSVPPKINCGPGGGPVCTAIFPSGTLASVQTTLTNTCQVSAYFGDGVIYPYAAGTGITFTPPITAELIEAQTLLLGNASLRLDSTGAPYASSGSIRISNGEVRIPITTNRVISAYLYS
jgi:hypothetical protein